LKFIVYHFFSLVEYEAPQTLGQNKFIRF